MVLIPYRNMTKITSVVAAALPQQGTNGNSVLGTVEAPQYGPFLASNPLPDGYPWGTATARQTNPYLDCPQTGVTRYYDFTIDTKMLAPDGYGTMPRVQS
jgi:hypothetical protein